MSDQEQAAMLLDRVSRRICLPETTVLEKVRDGEGLTKAEQNMFTQLVTEFAADLKP